MSQIPAYPPPLSPLDGTELIVGYQGGRVRAIPGGLLSNRKGDPGGVLNAIGTFLQAKTAAPAFNIPPGVKRVSTTGWSVPGVGGGDYVELVGAVSGVGDPTANLLASADNLTGAPWSSNCTSTTFEGTYSVLDDESTSYLGASQIVPAPAAGSTITLEARFAKDAVGTATADRVLRIAFSGAAGLYDIWFNTDSGSFIEPFAINSQTRKPLDWGIYDDNGPDWRVWVTTYVPDNAGTVIAVILPANSVNLVPSGAAMAAVSVRGVSLYAGLFPLTGYAPSESRTDFTAADGRVFQLSTDQLVTPYQFGAIDRADGTGALTAFADFTGHRRCSLVDVSYVGTIASMIVFTGGSTPYYTGDLELTATAAMEFMVRLVNMTEKVWATRLAVFGTGGSNIAARTVLHGVDISNCGRLRRALFYTSSFRFSGVHIASGTANSNYIDAVVHAFYCGSGVNNGQNSLQANWSAPVHNNGGGYVDSTNQFTTITVDAIPEDAINGPPGNLQVRINGRPYLVVGWTRSGGADGSAVSAGTINIFPYLDTRPGTSGVLTWIWGGGIYISGSNTNELILDVDAQVCGRAVATDALFGSLFTRVSGQGCGQLMAVGLRKFGVHQCDHVLLAYSEGCSEDFVIQSAGGDSARVRVDARHQHVDGNADWTFPVIHELTSFTPTNSASNNMQGTQLAAGHDTVRYEKADPAAYRKTSDPAQLNPNVNGTLVAETNVGPRKLNVGALSPGLRRNLGLSGARYLAHGSGPNGAPTAAITVTASDGLASGASSAVFSGFDGPVLLSSEYDAATGKQDVQLVAGKGPPMWPFVYGGDALAAGAIGATSTVTLAGAALGDSVDRAFLADQAGTHLEAWISAASTVKYRFSNPTGAAITLAAGTVNLRIRKA